MISIYNLFEKGFLKHLHRKYGKRTTKDNLVFAFHDLEGQSYYKFSKDVGMPMCRIAKANDYYSWLLRGIDVNEHTALLDKMDTALTDGLKNTKGISKIGFIVEQMRERVGMIVHDELYYNFIAIQMIRGDEVANVFNNEIHLEKVAAFRRMDEQSDVFFLATIEFRQLLNCSNITREEFQRKLIELFNLRKALRQMLSSI
jgi:hypothetical protein